MVWDRGAVDILLPECALLPVITSFSESRYQKQVAFLNNNLYDLEYTVRFADFF